MVLIKKMDFIMKTFSKLTLAIILGLSFSLYGVNHSKDNFKNIDSLESCSCKSVTIAALLWTLICCAECQTPCLKHQEKTTFNNQKAKKSSNFKMS